MGRLVFIDGFDHYDTAHFAEKWTTTGWIIDPVGGRNGGCAQTGGGYSYITKNLPADYNELIVGYAAKFGSLTGYGGHMVESIGFCNGRENPTLGIGVNAVGAVSGYAGEGFDDPNAAFGASANALVTINVWYYFEYHFNISAGTLIVHLNGVEVMNLTGVAFGDAFGDATVNQLWCRSSINDGPALCIDDLYLIDPSDNPANVWDQMPNTFLGDIRVATMTVSGPGRLTSFDPTPADAANWYAVSDAIPDDDASYVSSNTPDAVDTYTTTAPLVDTILGVQVCALMEKDSSGTRVIEIGVGDGTSEAYGPDLSLPVNYNYTTLTFAKNPLTSAAWTQADLGALELAVKVTG